MIQIIEALNEARHSPTRCRWSVYFSIESIRVAVAAMDSW